MLLPCGLGQPNSKEWPRSHGRNIVWNYKLGGYQVLLRNGSPTATHNDPEPPPQPLNEVQHFTNTARRIIAAILGLTEVRESVISWITRRIVKRGQQQGPDIRQCA